jgi:hypothetical protein
MTTDDIMNYVYKKLRRQKDIKFITLFDNNMQLNKLYNLDKLPLYVEELYTHDHYEFIMFEQMLKMKQRNRASSRQSSIFIGRKLNDKV